MPALSDYDPIALAQTLAGWGHKPSHAAVLLKHYYDHDGQVTYDDLELGKVLRQRLKAEIGILQSRIAGHRQSPDGTVKLLVTFSDGASVEAVLMPSHRPDRAAGCISSQVGCAMGCDFCASTTGGLERDLSAGEIVEQFLHLRRLARSLGRRLATVVFMGMGEPLHNYDNIVAAIRRIALPGMGELGGRQITVSTVGIVPGIDRLAGENLNVHLALSLHAPDDRTRSRLVPANKRYPVAEALAAVRRFEAKTGRIPTLEYCMLDGVNDSDAQAEELARLVGDLRAHVNLIPYNAIGAGVSGVEYRPSPLARVESFLQVLIDRGIVAHARRRRGDDIDAACGQLRRRTAGMGLTAPLGPTDPAS